MSRHSSRDRSVTIADGDGLAVIREEIASPFMSREDVSGDVCMGCSISSEKRASITSPKISKHSSGEIEAILAKREAELRAEFDVELKSQLSMLRERFDFVLQHEQVRSCYMLREAHRERKEKIQALQTQQECKNMSGLMYVLCSERRKAKLEKMRVISEYTKYIHLLQDILTEGQRLILHLSRGYKTAARVDNEWRLKMKSIIKEFQEYVYHFAGGTPESNQYVFDVPALLKTEAPIVDDPEEDPCTCEEEEDEEILVKVVNDKVAGEKTWWEQLDTPHPPFVVYGDMEEFLPPQRRQVIANAKQVLKSAPAKWKEYAFNEMYLKSDCPRADVIKDEYPKHLTVEKLECLHDSMDDDSLDRENSYRWNCRRLTTYSNDMRTMGSILKIVTTSNLPPKNNLLAARDSMEIASSTRVRGKKNGRDQKNSICFARTRSSSLQNLATEFMPRKGIIPPHSPWAAETSRHARSSMDNEEKETLNGLGSTQDSLLVISSHKAEHTDRTINYEKLTHYTMASRPFGYARRGFTTEQVELKICPMEKCQRLQVDSFMRSLPAYMRASPFMMFEQSFTEYETCSPEQLEILKQRLEQKQKRRVPEEDALSSDFEQVVDGIAVQTSEELITDLPPCTCRDPQPSAASSNTRVFNVEDLIPLKQALDEITQECFYNANIAFDRFQVVGQESKHTHCNERKHQEDFKMQRMQEIKNILRKHPSMLDLFQPNPQC